MLPLYTCHTSVKRILTTDIFCVCVQLSPGIMNTVLKGTFNANLNNPLMHRPRLAAHLLPEYKASDAVSHHTFAATTIS